MTEDKDEFDIDPFLDDDFDEEKGTFVRIRNPQKVGYKGYQKSEDRGDKVEGTALTRIQDVLSKYDYKESDSPELKARLEIEKKRHLKWVKYAYNNPTKLMRIGDLEEEENSADSESVTIIHKPTGFLVESFNTTNREQNLVTARQEMEKKLGAYILDWQDKTLSEEFRMNYGVVTVEKPQAELQTA